MEIFKRIFRTTSELFTLGFILYWIYSLVMKIETIYIIDPVLFIGAVFILLLGVVLSRERWFNVAFLNFIIPYIVIIFILFIGIGLVNHFNLSKELDMKLVISIYTGIYIIYSIIDYFIYRKNRNKIHF